MRTEKHHPASSQTTRDLVERGARRRETDSLNRMVRRAEESRQPRKFKESTGFFRGARVK